MNLFFVKQIWFTLHLEFLNVIFPHSFNFIGTFSFFLSFSVHNPFLPAIQRMDGRNDHPDSDYDMHQQKASWPIAGALPSGGASSSFSPATTACAGSSGRPAKTAWNGSPYKGGFHQKAPKANQGTTDQQHPAARRSAAANRHINGNVDTRTQHLLRRSKAGAARQWTGRRHGGHVPVTGAIRTPWCAISSETRCYIKDLNFDAAGLYVILYVTGSITTKQAPTAACANGTRSAGQAGSGRRA